MDRLEEDIETTVHSLLLILKQLGGSADFHKVFKIMYFADQKHLIKLGASISNDKYIAMQNGPVPSMTYDILKALRGEGLLVGLKDRFTPYFNLIKSYTVEAKQEPELENLSESEISAIRESIDENKNLNFEQLTEKSHDYAWKQAMRDGEIDLIDIAEAGGASKDMVKYIHNHLENLHATFE